MRAAGLLDHPAGVERGDHVCWAYDGDADGNASFEEAAVRFLAEGLRRGDRLVWIGDGAAERLRRAGGPLASVEELTARGALRLLPLADAYGAAAAFSPDDQLEFYDAATRRAIADGFTGLRVVAEITALAADPARRPELLRWERLADAYVARGTGFTAMCAYCHPGLSGETVGDVASLHPVAHVPAALPAAVPPFRVWFDDGCVVVEGEVDAFGADRFRRILTGIRADGPVVALDLSRVTFLDLAGCRVLAAWAEQLGRRPARVELVGAARIVRRIWQLLRPAGVPGTVFRDGRP